MAVDINKLKIRYKSADLLRKLQRIFKQQESARERALCQLTECF